jgi:hypothetical protein
METSKNEMRPQAGSLPDAECHWHSPAVRDFSKSDYPAGHIYDIGGSRIPSLLKQNVRKAFTPGRPGQPRSFPSELFFHGEGLAKWAWITSMPEFYQMPSEIALLEYHGANIARNIAPGSAVIDMGCGYGLKFLILH